MRGAVGLRRYASNPTYLFFPGGRISRRHNPTNNYQKTAATNFI